MRKKFLLGTIIPALAAVAVIGSGFSMWYFGDANNAKANQDANKEVTQLVRVGKIAVADSFTVRFDQTKEGHVNQIGSHTYNDADCVEATGITLKFAENANTKAIYTEAEKLKVSTKQEDADYVNYPGIDHTTDGKVYYEFTTKVTITNDLAAYVNISTTDANFTITETAGVKGATITTYTFTSKNNVSEFDWSKVVLTYAKDQEPDSLEKFKTFHDIVLNENTKISVEYSVTVSAK